MSYVRPTQDYQINGDASWHLQNEGVYAIDIGAPCGTPVYAVTDGDLIMAPTWWAGPYGCYLKGNDGKFYVYAHMQSNVGRKNVVAGEVIGQVGTLGNSTGCHLHFSVCDNYVDTTFGGNRSFDETTSFWNNGGSSGTGTGSSTGQGTGTPHTNYTPIPPDYIIELIPAYVTFYKDNDITYESVITNTTSINDGYRVNFSDVAQFSFTFNKVILKNKHGNWLHVIDKPEQDVGSQSPMNINWTITLEELVTSHSLLNKTGSNIDILNFMSLGDQTGLGNYLKKNSGWTTNGNTLSGNVKLGDKIKHNDNMYNGTDYPNTSNISYEPTLFSTEK